MRAYAHWAKIYTVGNEFSTTTRVVIAKSCTNVNGMCDRGVFVLSSIFFEISENEIHTEMSYIHVAHQGAGCESRRIALERLIGIACIPKRGECL